MDLHEFISPIGPLTLASRGDALVGLHLPGSADPRPEGTGTLTAILSRAASQLAEYFAGTRTEFDLALDPEGTAFQQRVWTALRAIPYGTTCSYQAIAKAIGQPTATRAVGMANHRNPIAIIIPCHRVVGAVLEKARGTQLGLSGLT
jgi:methylated-DNA-[protein]-cysteine S-methyltransferase